MLRRLSSLSLSSLGGDGASGAVDVREVRAGTTHREGAGARGQVQGAAYVFHRDAGRDNGNDGWVEHAKLILEEELAGPNDRFGWALGFDAVMRNHVPRTDFFLASSWRELPSSAPVR